MASQWLPYLQIQMADYLSGKRKMPEKMAEKVKPLSQSDLDALAALLRQREIREETNMTMDRRSFLKMTAGAGAAGALWLQPAR
jgi:cytochrome c553